ncbi:hypothetical protein V8C86DRAFT_2748303, partial [Haematococcus lacustris]
SVMHLSSLWAGVALCLRMYDCDGYLARDLFRLPLCLALGLLGPYMTTPPPRLLLRHPHSGPAASDAAPKLV